MVCLFTRFQWLWWRCLGNKSFRETIPLAEFRMEFSMTITAWWICWECGFTFLLDMVQMLSGSKKIEWLSHRRHNLLLGRCLHQKNWKAITETGIWQWKIIKLVMEREFGHTYLFIVMFCFAGHFGKNIKGIS